MSSRLGMRGAWSPMGGRGARRASEVPGLQAIRGIICRCAGETRCASVGGQTWLGAHNVE